MTALPPSTLPSATSYILATAILSLATGYLLGQASSLNILPSPFSKKSSPSKSKKPKKSWPNSYDVDIHPDSSDEELMTHLNGGKSQPSKKEKVHASEESGTESSPQSSDEELQTKGDSSSLKAFASSPEEFKLTLIVRTDLGMSKGKIAAQASHATLACYTHILSAFPSSPSPLDRWRRTGQAKIALAAPSEDELYTLQAKAISLGLCAQIIHDAGRTQIAAGSATVLGVGPGPKGVVDQVTGGLKLL